jgi:LacI family transcriptional regulator
MTTIREIARKAGVSIGTVDRVIHNRGRVSKQTEETIRRIIAEDDYRPNVFASHLSLSKQYTFAALSPRPEQDSRYWELPVRGIRKAERELKAYGVRIRYFHFDKYSESSFWRAGERTLRNRRELDGLVIAPVLSKAAERFLEQVPEDLPYVFIDSYVPKTRCLSSIGQNPYRSGALAAKLMDLLVNGRGTVAVFRVLPQDYHIDDRVNGFCAHFKGRKGIKLLVVDADIERDASVFSHRTSEILSENSNVRGIFIPNASGHQIAESLKDRSDAARVHLIGYDLVEDNLAHLRSGRIDFIISQRPEVQGYQAVQFLHHHLALRNPVPGSLTLPLDIVTRENIDDYLGSI